MRPDDYVLPYGGEDPGDTANSVGEAVGSASGSPGGASAPKVLVVDDERKLVELVRGYLLAEGLEVLVAYDGLTALEVASATWYRWVFVSSGVQYLRACGSIPSIPAASIRYSLRSRGRLSWLRPLCNRTARLPAKISAKLPLYPL